MAGGGLRVARVCLRAILCLCVFKKITLNRYVRDVWTDAIEKHIGEHVRLPRGGDRALRHA